MQEIPPHFQVPHSLSHLHLPPFCTPHFSVIFLSPVTLSLIPSIPTLTLHPTLTLQSSPLPSHPSLSFLYIILPNLLPSAHLHKSCNGFLGSKTKKLVNFEAIFRPCYEIYTKKHNCSRFTRKLL